MFHRRDCSLSSLQSHGWGKHNFRLIRFRSFGRKTYYSNHQIPQNWTMFHYKRDWDYARCASLAHENGDCSRLSCLRSPRLQHLDRASRRKIFLDVSTLGRLDVFLGAKSYSLPISRNSLAEPTPQEEPSEEVLAVMLDDTSIPSLEQDAELFI